MDPEVDIQANEQTTRSTAYLRPPKDWRWLVDDVYSILKLQYWDKIYQSINFTMEEEINGELTFLDNLLKQNHGCLYWYTESLYILINTWITSLATK